MRLSVFSVTELILSGNVNSSFIPFYYMFFAGFCLPGALFAESRMISLFLFVIYMIILQNLVSVDIFRIKNSQNKSKILYD